MLRNGPSWQAITFAYASSFSHTEDIIISFPFFFSLSFLLLSLLFGEQSAPADDTTGSHYGHTMTRFFFSCCRFLIRHSFIAGEEWFRQPSSTSLFTVGCACSNGALSPITPATNGPVSRTRQQEEFLPLHGKPISSHPCNTAGNKWFVSYNSPSQFKTSAIIKHSASSNTIRFLDLTRLFSLRPTRTRPNYLMSLRSRLICSSHRCWTFNGLCVCVCASLVKKTEDFGNNQNKTLETELIFVSTFVQMKAKVLIINNKKIDQCKPENTFRASRLLLLSLSSVHYYVSFLFCVFKSILCTIRVGSHANFESTRRWKSSHFSPIILPHFLFE